MNAKQVNADLVALLRAKVTLIWIQSGEELRVERNLMVVAQQAMFDLLFWDCASGLRAYGQDDADDSYRDPARVLEAIASPSKRAIYVLRDIHKWFDASCLRSLRNLQRDLQSSPAASARSIVLLTPVMDVPPELRCATVIEYPLPERDEIAGMLDTLLESLPDGLRASAANGSKEQAIDAALGLTAEEAANCYAKSLVVSKKISVQEVTKEKQRIIAREKVLTWYEADPRGLDAVGGLDELKGWLRLRQRAFSAEARAYGLPAPKGMLLVGVPGCGKSLTAKAVAAAWRMPLLRMDLGALRSKYVGESEGNLRRALKVAETVSPCILWIDEIEKAMGGATGPQGDGGVAADALGAVLSWMQEREGRVFVVATANDVRGLPPELLRKGRFDELWFVDLPSHEERQAIWQASLTAARIDAGALHLPLLAAASSNLTGAEIAGCIPDAQYAAFDDGARPVCTDDLMRAAGGVVPLSRTAADKIGALREWAKGRARCATRTETATATTGRQLEV